MQAGVWGRGAALSQLKTMFCVMAHLERMWPYDHLSLSAVSLYLSNTIKYTQLPAKPNIVTPKVQ